MDMLKTRHRENLLLQACLDMKQPFVVDNTNPTAAVRTKYLLAAKAARFQVIAYFFPPNLTLSLQRNAARIERERVPDKGIFSTFHKLQTPALDEGFDMLYNVLTVEPGNFLVEQIFPG